MNLNDTIVLLGSITILYIYWDSPWHWSMPRLIRFLNKYHVHHEEWRYDGNANNIQTLLDSLRYGEVWFERPKGYYEKPIQHINVAVATIVYKHGGEWTILQEHRRKQRDGDWVKRSFNGSVGGKARTIRETVRQTMEREIGEELGDTEPGFRDPSNYQLIFTDHEVIGPRPSDRYPGLLDVYHRTHFLVVLKPEDRLFRHRYEHVEYDHGVSCEIHFRWEVLDKELCPTEN